MSYIGNEPIVSATRTVTEVSATAGQTVFTANGGYTVGFIDVFVNGSKLTNSDFTATNGTTITLNEAAQASDIVRLEALGTFLTGNHVPLVGDSNITGNVNVSGNLGVGTTSPTAVVDVVTSSSANGISLRGRSSDNVSDISLKSNDGATVYGQIQGRSGDVRIQTNGSRSLAFFTNATERVTIDSSGRVTTPFQPAFMGRKIDFTATPWSAATSYNSSLVGGNYGTNFSTSTGRFTAPVSGVYLFSIAIRSVDNGTDDQAAGFQLWINGSGYQNIDFWGANAASWGGSRRPSAAGTFIVSLSANDYVQAAATGVVNNLLFSGTLIG